MKAPNVKLAPLAAVVLSAGLGLGLAGNAYAEAYAIAYDNLFDFQINQSPFPSVNFIFPNTVASNSSATLTGSAGCSLSDTGALADAAPCNLGAVAKANNDFTAQTNTGGNYSRSDAQVVSEQTTVFSFAQAVAIAESHIAGSGAGTGGSNNASDTSFSIPFVVPGPSTLFFQFNADSYMQVVLNNSIIPPSVARASLDAEITITDQDTGLQVFDWQPNGIVGAQGGCAAGQGQITGGCETLDQANLNTQIVRNFALNGTTTIDPTGDASVGVGTNGTTFPATFSSFAAYTNLLGNGNYLVTIRAGARTEVERIPEPASLALLGLGLTGLAFARRRKQQA